MGRYENLEHQLYDGVGEYGFPVLDAVTKMPEIDDWIQFNYAKSTRKNKEKTGVHFFVEDMQFERAWNCPIRYGNLLDEFGVVIEPDFSTFRNFPKAMRVYNNYRNMWLTRFWQDMGLTVIPSVGGHKEDWDWCFDGYPQGSIVAVSNIGSMENKESRDEFRMCYEEMLTRLQPKEVLLYCHKADDYKGPVRYIMFSLDKTNQAE